MQDKCLTEIKKARKLHLDWVRRAEMLVNGLAVEESSLPLFSDSCSFGIWFHAGAKQLAKIQNFQKIIDEIDKDHDDLHKEYRYIHDIFFKPQQDAPFIKKIFSKKEPTVSEAEQQAANKHLDTLQAISKSLTKNLNRFSSQVSLLTPEDIQKIQSETTL